MKTFISHLFCLTILAGTVRVHAVPTVTIETIKGFEVHFVDLAKGDTIAVSFITPFGTLHDAGRLMGRAHQLEHVMFNGSVRFPGYHTYQNTIHLNGGSSNAYTSDSHTFYYVSGPAAQAKTFIDYQLSMLGGLEWSAENFIKENEVVINEISDETNKKDIQAVDVMSLSHLLLPEHPWARPIYGDEASLKALKIEDLKQAYDLYYQPSMVKIAVIGNFSDPKLKHQIRDWIAEALPNKQPPTDYKPDLNVPSFFSSDTAPPESRKRLYLQSDLVKSTNMILEANDADPYSLQILVSYLNMNIPGSVLYRLSKELSWISDGDFSGMTFKNKTHLKFSASLSHSSSSRREDVQRLVFEALENIERYGIDSSTLDALKKSIFEQFNWLSVNPESFLKVYGQVLLREGSLDQQLKRLKSLRSIDVQKVAAQFRPERTLYIEVGESRPNMTFDPTFDRYYAVEDNTAFLQSVAAQSLHSISQQFKVQLRPVDLGEISTAPVVSVFERSKPKVHAGEKWALDFRTDLADQSAGVRFDFALKNKREFVALDIVSSAFESRSPGEISYLNLRHNLNVRLVPQQASLSAIASGRTREATNGLIWLIDQLADFEPTSLELDRAREAYMQDSQVAYSSKFSASLAVDQTQELVNPRHVSLMAGHDFASELTNQEILTMWHRIRRQSNKIYVMVGGFSREEFTAVQTAAQRLSPQTLDAIQPEQKAQTVAFEHRELLQPFAIARAKGPFAAIRTYRGPRSNELRDLMALSALNVVTSNRLQTQNRADQGLGYIHTSLVSPMDEHFSYFSLLGQTTSPEDVQLTIAGWARVLEQIRSEEIPDDELAQGLQAVRTSLQKKSFSSRGLLAEYMQNQFRYGDAKVRTHALGELNTLTPVDVRATAQKYLLAPNTPYLQVVYGDCETLLSGH